MRQKSGSILGHPLPVKISQVVVDPENPRTYFDEEGIAELADSIQSKGQETPIKVTKDTNQKGVFMLVSGERRHRAINLIWKRNGGLSKNEPSVDCLITIIQGGPHGRLLHAFAENVQREDMPVLDIAASLKKLRQGGESVSELVKLSGYSDAMVRNYIAIDGLPDGVKKLMHPSIPKKQRLQTTVAIDLAAVESETIQIEIATEAVDRNLGVAETRFRIEQCGGVGRKSIIRSGHERSPAERYTSFCRFLGRTNAWVAKFTQDGPDPIHDFYFNRDDETGDREKHLGEINRMISHLDKLKKVVEKPPK